MEFNIIKGFLKKKSNQQKTQIVSCECKSRTSFKTTFFLLTHYKLIQASREYVDIVNECSIKQFSARAKNPHLYMYDGMISQIITKILH